MTSPVPGRGITTPYGKPGNWSGGKHGGADWAAPAGTTVVAPWSGTVTAASWGSAFGTQVVIDFDRLPNGSPGLWGVLAHLSRRSVSLGQRVTVGQKIGEVGATGNATGPHLHFEVQKAANWRSGNHVNPQPWIDAQKPGSGGGYPAPTSKKVYLSKLRYGQTDSDSVWYLQDALNRHSIPAPGNFTIKPLSGGYFDQTDTQVRACQQHHGKAFGQSKPDPVKKSNVGPKQAAHIFAGRGLTIINDL